MNAVFFKLIWASSLLAGLAACGTTPQPTAAPQVGAVSTPAQGVDVPTQSVQPAQKPSLLANPDFSPSALEPQPDTAKDAEPALGEFASEYQRGNASWYGPGFHGKRTASGERYDMNALTAAHRTLPFGTLVRVKSLVNGREVLVRITDRGPFIGGRILDLSRAAANELGMLGLGFKQVALLVQESGPQANPLSRTKKRPTRSKR